MSTLTIANVTMARRADAAGDASETDAPVRPGILQIDGTADDFDAVRVCISSTSASLTQEVELDDGAAWSTRFDVSGTAPAFACGAPMTVEARGLGETACDVAWRGPVPCSPDVSAGDGEARRAEAAPDDDGRADPASAPDADAATEEASDAPPREREPASAGHVTVTVEPAAAVTHVQQTPCAPKEAAADGTRETDDRAPRAGTSARTPRVRTRARQPEYRGADGGAARAHRQPAEEAGAECAEDAVSRPQHPGDERHDRDGTQEQNRAVLEEIEARVERMIHNVEDELRHTVRGMRPGTERDDEACEPEDPTREEETHRNEDEAARPSEQDRLEALVEHLRDEVREAAHGTAQADRDGDAQADEAAESGEASAHDARSGHDLVETVRREVRAALRQANVGDGSTDAPAGRAEGEQPETRPDTDDDRLSEKIRREVRALYDEDHDAEEAPAARRVGDGQARRGSDGRGRAAGCPAVHFKPVEIGAQTTTKQRPVKLVADLVHPSGAHVSARLLDGRTGDVLADESSDTGQLTLTHENEYEPGEYAVTVDVRAPDDCPRTEYAFTVPSALPEAFEEQRTPRVGEHATAEKQEQNEEGGWPLRALGAAWAVLLTLFLLVLGAGTNPILVGPAAALVAIVMAPYLALYPATHWVRWTGVGLALTALTVLALLPSTPLLRMDASLMAAAAAGGGFGIGALVVYFR